MAAHLPLESLPIRFALPFTLKAQGSIASTRSAGLSLAPCLTVEIEGIEIFRTLDPEAQESFLSAGRLFFSQNITPLQALFRFKRLHLFASSDLGGLAPFHDMWIPMDEAIAIAEDLKCGELLGGLLDPKAASAWTILDYESGSEPSLLHNWRIPQNALPAESYSTESMLSTPFPSPLMNASGLTTRTQIDMVYMSQQPQTTDINWYKLISELNLSSAIAFSAYAEREEQAPVLSEVGNATDSTMRSRIWTVLATFSVLHQIASPSTLREYAFNEEETLSKANALRSSVTSDIVMLDMIAKLAISLYRPRKLGQDPRNVHDSHVQDSLMDDDKYSQLAEKLDSTNLLVERLSAQFTLRQMEHEKTVRELRTELDHLRMQQQMLEKSRVLEVKVERDPTAISLSLLLPIGLLLALLLLLSDRGFLR